MNLWNCKRALHLLRIDQSANICQIYFCHRASAWNFHKWISNIKHTGQRCFKSICAQVQWKNIPKVNIYPCLQFIFNNEWQRMKHVLSNLYSEFHKWKKCRLDLKIFKRMINFYRNVLCVWITYVQEYFRQLHCGKKNSCPNPNQSLLLLSWLNCILYIILYCVHW